MTTSPYPQLIALQKCGKPCQEELVNMFSSWYGFFLPGDAHDIGLSVSPHFKVPATGDVHEKPLFGPESSSRLNWRCVLVATLELVDAPAFARGKLTIWDSPHARRQENTPVQATT